jgi:hypothetical protein
MKSCYGLVLVSFCLDDVADARFGWDCVQFWRCYHSLLCSILGSL